MGRHNREGRGADQYGNEYVISYPPDWLSHIKITRVLPTGRQSTMTLFRNPDAPAARPGKQIRTRIQSSSQDVDVEITLADPARCGRQLSLDAVPPGSTSPEQDCLTLTLHAHTAASPDQKK